MTDPIEKVLKELRCRHEPEDCKDCRSLMKEICKTEISQALTLIRQHYEKKMEGWVGSDEDDSFCHLTDFENGRVYGHNEAKQEIRAKIKEE